VILVIVGIREKAYTESKLQVEGLAFAVARRWPHVLSNAAKAYEQFDEHGRMKPSAYMTASSTSWTG